MSLNSVRVRDGFPEGFTLSDNRDLWVGPGYQRPLLRPISLGVYLLLTSLPQDWVFKTSWLTARLGVGRDLLRKIAKELEGVGRLRRDPVRDANGRFIRTEWTFYKGGIPTPAPKAPAPENPSTNVSGSPAPRNTAVVKTKGKSAISSKAAPAAGGHIPDEFTGDVFAGAGKSAPLLSTVKAPNTGKTTTTEAVSLDWSAKGLKALTDEDRVVVVGLLNGHGQDTQQAVLDEFAGCIEDKVVKNSPMGLLAKLAAAARAGDFVLNRGRRVRDERIAKATAATKRALGENTESRYENAINFARQTFGPGGNTPNKAEFERLMAEAAAKWPEEATKSLAEASARGERRAR